MPHVKYISLQALLMFCDSFSTCGNGGRTFSPSSMNVVQQGVKFDNYATCGKMLLSKFHECTETESSFHMWEEVSLTAP